MDKPPAEPAISFVVPAYNEERELPATLRCIEHAARAAGPYEIVVVDDASTDATPLIAAELGVRVVHISRRQIAASRNAGAQASRGNILVFVDADTHIKQEHVVGLLQAFENGAAGGAAWMRVEGELPRWARLFFAMFSFCYFRIARLGAGGFLFTTRANFDAIGGFDETYFAAEEVFFTLSLKRLGRFSLLREPVTTSGRKLRLYSGAALLRQMLQVGFGGRGAVTSRRHLDLWYGGARE